MPRRDPYSRWNRLPPVYRAGEHKIPGPEDEPQRIILYLKGALLDLAEKLAERAGVPTVQEYCAGLLAQAIEVERVKHHVADLEATRGELVGFREISGDVHYLTEWKERAESREDLSAGEEADQAPTDHGAAGLMVPPEVIDAVLIPEPDPAEDEPVKPEDSDGAVEDSEQPAVPPPIRITVARPMIRTVMPERIVPEVMDGSAIATVWANVAPGDEHPHGFLPTLRRGRAVAPERVSELLEALGRIEADQRGSALIDRTLSYALHRLSLEAQVLLTEAWPGVFDARTVAAIRAVQGMVERILSGQGGRSSQPGDGTVAEEHS
ncbi:MAG: hypothetical protein U0790_18880 [Isosphaeraceae bacterium]